VLLYQKHYLHYLYVGGGGVAVPEALFALSVRGRRRVLLYQKHYLQG
jgi:hypothetical protein